ncbi:dual specificity protein phosphatase family protein [Vibrio vulnificus]|uniref:dual specificity protein phosphatase family protein n=1 Tax=Vibrio vulnificus TaxID=672 RepID=UPI001F5E556F|nr:dual specificity protein phosphatase family protein [Vibrio vulnificus]
MCNGKVIFVSQREAETIHPEPGVAMISITDPGKPLAELGSWELIYRDSFMMEAIVKTLSTSIKMSFECAIVLILIQNRQNFISQLISSGVNKIYVHCYFGRSRSGAVAKYLVDQFGFESNKPIESPNMTVYKLLCNPVRFEPLIQQYEQAAKAPKEEKQPTISQKFVDLLMVALGLKK